MTTALRNGSEWRLAWPTVAHFTSTLATTAPAAFTRAVLLRVGVVLAEGLGIVLLFPLLRLTGILAPPAAGGSAPAVDAFLGAVAVSVTWPMVVAAYGIVAIAHAILQRASLVASMRLQEDFVLRLRNRLFRAIVGAEWRFLVACRGPQLTHAVTGEIERFAPATFQMLNMVSAVLSGAVCLGIALRLSLPMTLVAVGTGILTLAGVRRLRRRARATGQRLADATADLFATASEHVAALKTTKSLGAESHVATTFADASKRTAELNVDTERLHADAAAVLEIASVLVLTVALYVGIVGARLDAATIVVLLYVFARLTPRFAALQGYAQNFMLAMPSFARVLVTLHRCDAAAESVVAEPARPLLGALTLEQVRFRYAGRETTDTLQGVSLSIEAGKTTAIVGRSGAGKSTVADLVLGLLQPIEGTIRIDGIALTPARARGWRESVGYVGQDAILLHDTVRANLLSAAPAATEADIACALRLAAADDFVASLPRQLDTVVGDRGMALSAGERQRLALSRALVRSPALLILDEPTSAIDAHNEARIQHAIASLRGRTSILLITHRLATVRSADFIYVIDEGRVVEQGTWDGLLARSGRFAAMCNAQGCVTEYTRSNVAVA